MRMYKLKKPAFALLAGFITIYTLNSISQIFIFQEVQGISGVKSPLDTPIYHTLLHTIISLIIPIVGGMVVGLMVKKNGAYYGGVLAIILKMISIAVIASIFIYPPAFYGIPMQPESVRIFAWQNIIRAFISIPFAILFMAWGGWIGEKLSSYKNPIFTRI